MSDNALNNQLSDISELFLSVSKLIEEARKRVAISVNVETTMLNYRVGSYIHTFMLEGNRAPYGLQIMIKLADKLTYAFGSGWSDKHLRHCLRCAESFSFIVKYPTSHHARYHASDHASRATC